VDKVDKREGFESVGLFRSSHHHIRCARDIQNQAPLW
jgi:hypothetical protein